MIAFDKNLKLVAVEKETGRCYVVESIFFPLGKPSGKDVVITIPTDDDSEYGEWRSINEVDIKQAAEVVGADCDHEDAIDITTKNACNETYLCTNCGLTIERRKIPGNND
jgi:hypothetical protein